MKFVIVTDHPFAWQAVQELGYVLNYLSIEDRLPTVFYPVSPPPYLNGGPGEYLSWVIENIDEEFLPAKAAEWLVARLPGAVEWGEV